MNLRKLALHKTNLFYKFLLYISICRDLFLKNTLSWTAFKFYDIDCEYFTWIFEISLTETYSMSVQQ